jgi:hypothetical protein
MKNRLPVNRKPSRESRLILTDAALMGGMRKLLRVYADEVAATDLTQTSKQMYIEFAECFVRWAHGDFAPGINGPCHSKRLSAKPPTAKED